MHSSIGRNAAGLYLLAGMGPTTFDECGLSHPAATCHTPRPSEGRDGDTGRRWCL
jgi:hypothetical protein